MKDRIVEAWDQVQLSDAARIRIQESLAREPKAPRHPPRFQMAAVMAVLVFILSTVVVASTLDRIWLTVEPISLEEGAQGSYLVSFRPTDDAPIDLGNWYPQWLPEGFEEYYVGSDEYGIRTIIFENDEEFICLTYGKANANRNWLVRGVDEVTEGKVGERSAILLTRTGDGDGVEQRRTLGNQGVSIPLGTPDQILLWDDGERGVGFILDYVGGGECDLIRIAESMALMKEAPQVSYANYILAAIRKLGDYQLGYIPEGFVLEGVYGTPAYPLMNPEIYGYVHRVYVDQEFYRLELYYEFIPLHEGTRGWDAKGEYTYEDVKIGSIYGRLVLVGEQMAVFWQQTDENGIKLQFTVKADRLSREELLKVAESVYCAHTANTDKLNISSRYPAGYNP